MLIILGISGWFAFLISMFPPAEGSSQYFRASRCPSLLEIPLHRNDQNNKRDYLYLLTIVSSGSLGYGKENIGASVSMYMRSLSSAKTFHYDNHSLEFN